MIFTHICLTPARYPVPSLDELEGLQTLLTRYKPPDSRYVLEEKLMRLAGSANFIRYVMNNVDRENTRWVYVCVCVCVSHSLTLSHSLSLYIYILRVHIHGYIYIMYLSVCLSRSVHRLQALNVIRGMRQKGLVPQLRTYLKALNSLGTTIPL